KQNVYEDGMKAPLILSGPGVPHGQSDAFAYLHDIDPTVCALAGVPVPEGLDGKDLSPILRGESDRVRDAVFLAYRSVQRAVRRGDWKLIRYPEIHKTQLFDLKSDPGETVDLAGDPRYAGRVAELTDVLRREQAAAGDRLPLS